MEEIEARAERVLAGVPEYMWDGESLPVPVEDVADSVFGLLVRDVDDLTTAPECPPLDEGQSLSGLLLAGPGEIWVNADEGRQWPGRRRFTIGHELGHWVMHADGTRSLFCRKSEVQENTEEAGDADSSRDIEDEASIFAAALMMPAHLIEHHYHRLDREGKFERMCELFGASQMAMGKRLHAVI